jgi:phosphotransferase system HPr-like phosphotransfer protein
MSSGVSKGHRVRVTADGPDEDAAIDTLEQFIATGMGETIADEPSGGPAGG